MPLGFGDWAFGRRGAIGGLAFTHRGCGRIAGADPRVTVVLDAAFVCVGIAVVVDAAVRRSAIASVFACVVGILGAAVALAVGFDAPMSGRATRFAAVVDGLCVESTGTAMTELFLVALVVVRATSPTARGIGPVQRTIDNASIDYNTPIDEHRVTHARVFGRIVRASTTAE